MNKFADSQLKSLSALKHDARFTARSSAWRSEQEAALLSAIGARHTTVQATAPVYTLADYLSYIKATQLPTLTTSFAGALAVLVVLFGGSLGTVNAASNSLPGDPLYGLKLVTEQVQLRLASLQDRAVLHTEFAGRRLAEATALQQTGPTNPNQQAAQTANVKVAVNAFKTEIASANADLQALAASGNADALQTASQVAEQITAFNTTLDATAASSASTASDTENQDSQTKPDDDSSTIKTEVADARDATRETQSTAVAVVVDTHEAAATTSSTRDVASLFQQQLGDLRGRQTFDLHRVTVVQTALAKLAPQLANTPVPSADDFKTITYNVTQADAGISQAMDLFAEGAYRAAFDKLRSVDGELIQVEARLADVENIIVNALPQS